MLGTYGKSDSGGRPYASHAGDLDSRPRYDKLKSLKQVVTALLPNARQRANVTDPWKRPQRRISHATVGMAR